MSGAFIRALQIGFSPMFSSVGGIAVTIPAILFWHIIIGLGEAVITATLISQLQRVQPAILSGLHILRGETV